MPNIFNDNREIAEKNDFAKFDKEDDYVKRYVYQK